MDRRHQTVIDAWSIQHGGPHSSMDGSIEFIGDQRDDVREEGYPELVTTTWFSLSGPRGMSDGLTQRLNREVVAALHRADVRERLDRDAVLADPLTPGEFAAFLAREITRWAPLVRESGITVE